MIQKVLICIFLSNFYLLFTASQNCPEGSTPGPSGNICYQTFSQPISWFGAEFKCQLLGGHLASISDAFGNSYIRLLEETTPEQPPLFWLGGSTVWDNQNWRWADKSGFNYTYWEKGQTITGFQNDSCLAQQVTDGKWVVQKCETQLPYVCEIILQTSTPTTTTVTPSPKPSCPNSDGWVYSPFNNKCYFVEYFGTLPDWNGVLSYCRNRGLDMVSIHSNTENTVVSSIISSVVEWNNWNDMAWIGLYKSQNDNNWYWTDNTYVNFTFWDFGNPGGDIYGLLIGNVKDVLGWKAYSDCHNCEDGGVVICQKNLL